jgi:dTDP-4-amino-4,6-dideoxygalactose transaminase
MLDLHAQYEQVRDQLRAAIDVVLNDKQFILGPAVTQLEQEVAEYSQCAHGVGVSSGTDALLVALMAEDVGPGDEVITTPYTFFATAGCIARLGAKPVFVDIHSDTFNINASQIEERITEKTKAIIPVHLFGQCAEMDPILDIAKRHGLVVIEDAAQAIGSEWRGRRAGSVGHYGCFSFFPSKNLGAAGDGGMVVTQCSERAERLRVLRAHGSKPKYHHHVVGGNFRLDTLQAAIVSVKLRFLDDWTEARRRNADLYRSLLGQAGLGDAITLPGDSEHDQRHIYNQFVLRVPQRDALQLHLKQFNIATAVYYPVPLHLQECFAYLGHRPGDFAVSEAAANETVALPIYPELSKAHVQYVVEQFRSFYQTAAPSQAAA